MRRRVGGRGKPPRRVPVKRKGEGGEWEGKRGGCKRGGERVGGREGGVRGGGGGWMRGRVGGRGRPPRRVLANGRGREREGGEGGKKGEGGG